MKNPANLMQKSLIEKHNLILEIKELKAKLRISELYVANFKYHRERVERALAESIKLQSHYARLLNYYDGGKRLEFASTEQWIERLETLSNPTASYSKGCLAHDIPGATCQKPDCDC